MSTLLRALFLLHAVALAGMSAWAGWRHAEYHRAPEPLPNARPIHFDLSDDERFALLKPQMDAVDVDQLYAGKKLRGQGCGIAWGRDGKSYSAFWNSYEYQLTNPPRTVYLSMGFIQDGSGGAISISGPGFDYRPEGEKWVRIDR